MKILFIIVIILMTSCRGKSNYNQSRYNEDSIIAKEGYYKQ